MRDWFFYVVWYNRLKKLIQNLYDTELLQQELEGNSKYSKILGLIEKEDSTISDLKQEFGKIQKQEEQSRSVSAATYEVVCPQVSLNIYSRCMLDSPHPEFVVHAANLHFFHEVDLNQVHTLKVSLQNAEVRAFEKQQKQTLPFQLRSNNRTPMQTELRQVDESANLCDQSALREIENAHIESLGQTTKSFIKGASQMKFNGRLGSTCAPSSESASQHPAPKGTGTASVFDNVLNTVFSFGGLVSLKSEQTFS